MPQTEPPVSGAPTRVWLNKEISPALLEGMRMIARTKPENPRQVLGQFLIDWSPEPNDVKKES